MHIRLIFGAIFSARAVMAILFGLCAVFVISGCGKKGEAPAPAAAPAPAPAAVSPPSSPDQAASAASSPLPTAESPAASAASSPGSSSTPEATPASSPLGVDGKHKANIAFNAPTEMQLGESTQIELRLAPSQSASVEKLKAAISVAAPGPREGAAIVVSNRVQATLTGSKSKFEITSITPDTQPAADDETVLWKWDVKPLEDGEGTLHLTVNSIVRVSGTNSDTLKTVESFDHTIKVRVRIFGAARRFVEENWKWLWATLLVPAFGWIWRRAKPGTKPANP